MKKLNPAPATTPNLQIINRGVHELQAHPRNARVHPEANLKAVMKSLTEFGQRTPVVTWNNYVIKGCGTLESVKRLGWTEIATVEANALSSEQAEAYALADNKTTDMSHFDFSIVADVLRDLEGKKLDLDMTGFQQFEREPLMQASFNPGPAGELPTAADQNSKSLKFNKDQWAIIQQSLPIIRESEPEFDTTTEAAAIISLLHRFTQGELSYNTPF